MVDPSPAARIAEIRQREKNGYYSYLSRGVEYDGDVDVRFLLDLVQQLSAQQEAYQKEKTPLRAADHSDALEHGDLREKTST